MNVDDLKKLGGIVTAPPVEFKRTWVHLDPVTGEEHSDEVVFHVKHMTVEDHHGMLKAIRRGCDEIAATLVAGVRLDGGKQKLSYDEAAALDPELSNLFAEAVEEVNQLGKKLLLRKTKSSTRSSSPASAGERSQKQDAA